MWLILGIGAVVFAFLNLMWAFKNKNASWFRFISMSLTSLTLCASYAAEANRVVVEDWGGLMDVMPDMSKALWICTIFSIFLNSISLFNRKNNY